MSPSRRDVIRGLAGLPLLSCRSGANGRRIAGTIVGGAQDRGHRLRAGFHPEPARSEDVPVVIVGGGIAGLTAAWTLERAGFHDFVILELEDVAGGTARSGSSAVTPYPWGAHYVPVPPVSNRPLLALLEEVGAVAGRDAAGRPRWAESVLVRDPQERVFFKGEWYEGLYPRVGASAADQEQLDAFEKETKRLAASRDGRGRRAFAVPRARSSDSGPIVALDGLSMAAWMDGHGFTSPRLRWFVDYACRDDFGSTLAQTSAWAGLHYFAGRIDAPGGEPAEFLTWPEGNGRLVAHLAKQAGPRLRTGALVYDVAPRPGVVDVLYHDALRNQAVRLRAGHVVFALPRFLAGYLIAPWREKPPAFTNETVYGSWLVANLTLRDRPTSRGFPMAWDNVLYDSAALGYVVATHQTGQDRGATVWTYYRPVLDDDARRGRARLLATRWDDAVEEILRDLERAHHGLRDLVERVDLYLWGHAMVRPRPGTLWNPALGAAAAPLGRVHFAHTDLSAMALFEEAHYWGVRSAEAVLRERRHAFRSWLDERG